MTLDEALYYIKAAFESSTDDVTDAQLKEAVRIIVERNDLLEQTLTDAYTVVDKAQGILGRVL